MLRRLFSHLECISYCHDGLSVTRIRGRSGRLSQTASSLLNPLFILIYSASRASAPACSSSRMTPAVSSLLSNQVAWCLTSHLCVQCCIHGSSSSHHLHSNSSRMLITDRQVHRAHATAAPAAAAAKPAEDLTKLPEPGLRVSTDVYVQVPSCGC